RACRPRFLGPRTRHMQSDPPVGTRGFPSRDGGFRSPASAVGVLKTPIARRANQRGSTQTVAVETLSLARRVAPPSQKRGTIQQQQQQQQQQQRSTMRKSRATLNSTAAGATAAVSDAGGVMARTVVINSNSVTRSSGGVRKAGKVVKADVAFNRRGTGAATTKATTPRTTPRQQSPPTTGTPTTA
ncbi:unnamed protein product, partial [Laminaria digitata]